MPNMKNFDNTLYCITAEKYSQGKDNIEVVHSMLNGGAKIVQYREKDKSMLEKYNQCIKIRELTKKYDATFIVNDDIALAVAVDACGVHVGQDDLPIEKVLKIVPSSMIVGLSTHSPEQAENAVKSGVHYIGVGPIYYTETKTDVCAPVGLEYLDYVVKNIDIPYVAIGGIKESNIEQVLNHKAKNVCMVTEIVSGIDIENTVKNNIKTIKTANM